MFEISIGITLGIICFLIIKAMFKDVLVIDTNYSKHIVNGKFKDKFNKK